MSGRTLDEDDGRRALPGHTVEQALAADDSRHSPAAALQRATQMPPVDNNLAAIDVGAGR